MKHQMMLLQQKQKLLDLQSKAVSEKSTDNKNKKRDAVSKASKDMSIKETTFECPTEEDIKQLVEHPTNLDEKKKN
jgi:hypothetical protein